jgi:hypothetical protein
MEEQERNRRRQIPPKRNFVECGGRSVEGDMFPTTFSLIYDMVFILIDYSIS